MKLLIEKKSGKKFSPPFDGDGSNAIAVGLCENAHDPKHRQAYVLEMVGSSIATNVTSSRILKILKTLDNRLKICKI